MVIRRTDPQVGLGRYFTNLKKTYSDVIKDKQAKHNANYEKIMKLLLQLNDELTKLKYLEYSQDIGITDVLSQLFQKVGQESALGQVLDVASLINSNNNMNQLIRQQQQRVNERENQFKQALKTAFLFNIEVQQNIHEKAPEFFDFISIRDKNNKTNLFMLDAKQLESFINQKDLVDFIPKVDKQGRIVDYQLSLLRNQDKNIADFDNRLLSYLQNKENAYQLNTTVAEQVFNNNSTYNKFMTKDKFYSKTSGRENKNLGQRTELMLKQLLNGKTVEEAYENDNNILWQIGKNKQGEAINILRKDSEFGGAIGDSLGAIGIDKTNKEFTFLNKKYTSQINTFNYEKVYGNFQIKSLNLKKDKSTFDFGSASSIIKNNRIYADKNNFQQAMIMYNSWIMADPGKRMPDEATRDLQYQAEVNQAYELARDFVFSFADGFSDSELTGLDEFANDLGNQIADMVAEQYSYE